MSEKRHAPEQSNGKLRNALLDGELFNRLNGARVIIERWRQPSLPRTPSYAS